jgi:16S rRNA (guanine966-N2)-methyltransferase
MARLRIIAGEFGGRFISADVGSATHPMGDRVRSGLFSMLESKDVLRGADVLDAFAGTGALGFESLSRGAKFVTFVERDRRAVYVIDENITTLGVERRVKLIKTGVGNFTKSDTDDRYDIIFADPPYHKTQLSTVFSLIKYLKKDGLMIISLPGREALPNPDGVVVVDNRTYGEANLVFYKRNVRFG